MQIRIKEDLSADELRLLLEVAEAEIASLRQQLADEHAARESLEKQLEAVGAGGVSLMGSQ